jgi:hypothetical protein
MTVERRTRRAIGALAAVGGVLSILVWIPPRWYGSPASDSYVFDPPAFSPLWVERVVVPTLTVLAGALLVAGLFALVRRDRDVAGRRRRWSGYVALAGLACLELAEILFEVVEGASAGGASDLLEIGGLLLALAVGAIGLVLALPGTVALGVGYLRAGRRTVGAALIAGPLLTVAVFAALYFFPVGPAGVLLQVAPMGLAFVVVGYELWTHPEPAPAPDSDAGNGETRRGDAGA